MRRLRKIGVIYYYNSYKLIFNSEHINDELIDGFLLNKSEKSQIEDTLNNNITNKLKTNSDNRHMKAIDKIDTLTDEDRNVDKYIRRSNDSYVEDNYKLTNLLVDCNMVDIRQVVKTQKRKK